MIFISSKTPLSGLPDTKEEIYKYDWFIFSSTITNKDYHSDEHLYRIYNNLIWYPLLYKDKLYNYLLTDEYYYESKLHNVIEHQITEITIMEKFKYIYKPGIVEIIQKQDRIFGEDDIRDMFLTFRKNNFRENPVCEYILG